MVVWVLEPTTRLSFSAMRLFSDSAGQGFEGRYPGQFFCAGLLENACWTLLWPVFGSCMTGFELDFDFGVAVQNL